MEALMPGVRGRLITTSIRKNAIGLALAGAVALTLSTSAWADTTTIPNMTIEVGTASGGNSLFNPSDLGSSWGNPNGTFGFTGSTSNPGTGAGGWGLGWNLLVNPDPFIIANLVVTNNSLMTETFELTVTMPIGMAFPFGTLIGGSVTGSLTDLNGNGATLGSVAGDSLYTALLDGVAVATLLDGPFSVSAGNFESQIVGPASFGEPIPSEIGPAVMNTMAIRLRFTLSAGDAASFTSIFVVEDIPAPGVLALFVLAGAAGRRRRR